MPQTRPYTIQDEDGTIHTVNVDASISDPLLTQVLDGAMRAKMRSKAWTAQPSDFTRATNKVKPGFTGTTPAKTGYTPASVNAITEFGKGVRMVKEALVGEPEKILTGEQSQIRTPFGDILYPKGLGDAMAIAPTVFGGLGGFYSRTAEWLRAIPQEKFSAEQLLGMLKSAPVKKEELQWLGLEDWLKQRAEGRDYSSPTMDPEMARRYPQIADAQRAAQNGSQLTKVSKQDILDFINDHQIQMHEVRLGTGAKKYSQIPQHWEAVPNPAGGYNIVDTSKPEHAMGYIRGTGSTAAEAEDAALENLRRDASFDAGAQYNEPEYKTPGGRNYREVLLKFPNSPQTRTNAAGEAYQHFVGPDQRYRSSHFGDQGQDLLAHARVQDFKDVDGKKVLLVDEVQSDWHREGRKYGYQGEDPQASMLYEEYQTKKREYERRLEAAGFPQTGPLRDDYNRFVDTNNERFSGNRGISANAPPDAPFKSSWHELMMKTMLRDAVDRGYDKIAWTTGKMQQDRWNLTRFFPDLKWSVNEVSDLGRATSGTKTIRLDSQSRNVDLGAPVSNLEDYVGQAAADHIRSQIAAGTTSGHMRDVKSGGEWAENLYDKVIPEFMSRYGKQWGAKVEKTGITGASGTKSFQLKPDSGITIEPYRQDFFIKRSDGKYLGEEGWGEDRKSVV